MPTVHNAVECKQCKKMHKVSDRYIQIAVAKISMHLPDDLNKYEKLRQGVSVAFEDVVVCDDNCLTELLTLGNKRDSR